MGGYFNSSKSGVTFTPEEEFFKLLFGVKITPKKITLDSLKSVFNTFGRKPLLGAPDCVKALSNDFSTELTSNSDFLVTYRIPFKLLV